RSRRGDPVACPLRHEARRAQSLGVRGARKPEYRDAEAVLYDRIELYPSIGAWDFLHRPAYRGDALVVAPHEVLGAGARAGHVGGTELLPEDDRQQHEIVGQHGTSDDAVIAMVESDRRGRHAGPTRIVDVVIEEAKGAWVIVPLEVPPDLVMG